MKILTTLALFALLASQSVFAQLEPNKEEYDKFMAAWGEDRVEQNREITKNYPSMREITGEYLVRKITLK